MSSKPSIGQRQMAQSRANTKDIETMCALPPSQRYLVARELDIANEADCCAEDDYLICTIVNRFLEDLGIPSLDPDWMR